MSPAEAPSPPHPHTHAPTSYTRAHTHTHCPVCLHTCTHTRTARVSAHAHTRSTARVSVTQGGWLAPRSSCAFLHRKGFDCGLEAKNLGFNCTTSQGKVEQGPGVGREQRAGKQSTRNSGQREPGEAGSQWGGGQGYSGDFMRRGEAG